ncbi:hypothetical protein ABZ342_41865 [Amycolatopsis sp. NPDC005961]|uniref:hypothetical protein n=1 Tax=Amycolatopsis sp. NPDC005961 TaxID=3156720 RepID=UPI00341048EE
MTDLETRLREVVLAEPPLGFDPDDVATKAAKRLRNRRATVATVAVTLGIAGAAVVALRPSPPPPTPPAATYLPPVIVVKPPQQPQTPLELRNLAHLEEVLPAVIPGARKIVIDSFYSMGGELHADEMSTSISFVDHEGKGHSFTLAILGKLTVARNTLPVSQACPPGGRMRCDRIPRPDGSTVVISEVSEGGLPGAPPSTTVAGRAAAHYRVDGTSVDVSDLGRVAPMTAAELGLPAPRIDAPAGDGLVLDDRQLIALVTDPGFVAQ